MGGLAGIRRFCAERTDHAGWRCLDHGRDRHFATLARIRGRPREAAASACNGSLVCRDCPGMSRSTMNGAAHELVSQPVAERQRLIDQREQALPWWRWDRICQNDSGAPYARTTRPTAAPGIPSHTTMLA